MFGQSRNLIHSAHATHVAATAAHRGGVLFLDLRRQNFRCQDERRNRSRVLQSRTRHFHRIDHARADELRI